MINVIPKCIYYCEYKLGELTFSYKRTMQLWPILRSYFDTRLKGLAKIMKNFTLGSWYLKIRTTNDYLWNTRQMSYRWNQPALLKFVTQLQTLS